MSDIHINRSGQNLGIFSETEVQAGLDGGKYLGTDLAWRAGMEAWKPLAQWADFTVPLQVPPTGLPSLPGGVAVPGLAAGLPPAAGELEDLPSWEQKEQVGYFTAFAATVKEVLLEPGATFARMKETGGFFSPLAFLLIGSVLMKLVLTAEQWLMPQNTDAWLVAQVPALAAMANNQATMNPVSLIVSLLFFVIFVSIFSFVGAGIWHVSLLMLGGARKSFEATYRVYSYVAGATTLLLLHPCCFPIPMIWMVVAASIGLSKVHEIGIGKAILVIFLPSIFCCAMCSVGIYFFAQSVSGNPDLMNAINAMRRS